MRILTAALLWVAVVAQLAAASPGDRESTYRFCTSACVAEKCPMQARELQQRYGRSSVEYDVFPVPTRVTAFVTQMFHWSCDDECRYQCMWQVTETRQKSGLPVLQYHGKWPFRRLGGIQEPASVLFSVLNGVGHYRYLRKLVSVSPFDASRMRPLYIANACISVSLWVFSTLFHWRDAPWTERLDYFGAGASVLFSAFVGTVRVFNMRRTLPLLLLASSCLAAYIAHVTYLSLWRFDYGYNMAANVTVGAYYTLIWVFWALRHWNRPHARRQLVVVLGIAFSMTLELYDFAPWHFILDAHSLWHLATAFIVPYHEQFYLVDMLAEGPYGYRHPVVQRELGSAVHLQVS